MRFSISVKTSLASGMCASFLFSRGWDRCGAIEEQAGARLGERGGAHRLVVFALKVLPVAELGRHTEQRERGHGGCPHAEFAQGRLEGRGEGLIQLRLASFQPPVDSQAPHPPPADPPRLPVVYIALSP